MIGGSQRGTATHALYKEGGAMSVIVGCLVSLVLSVVVTLAMQRQR